MAELQDRFNQFVVENQLVKSGQKILLAVSGGADSMAMARLFKDGGYQFGIAHVNFNLRKNESKADEALVRKTAQRWKAAYHPLDADTKAYMKKHKLSVQEAARNIRYEWFEQLAADHRYDCIATAHHLDDSIETFFINLLRGTGIHGLKGIPVQNGKLIRPLLFCSSEDLRRFVRSKRIKFREDSSNYKDEYLRNKIRHHLIPLMLKLQPAFRQVMKKNIEHFQFGAARYDEAMQLLNDVLLTKDKGATEISIPAVLAYRQSDELLIELLKMEGIDIHEPGKILLTGKPGKKFFTTNHVLLRDREQLIIQNKTTIPETTYSVTVDKANSLIKTISGNFLIRKIPYQKDDELNLPDHTLIMDAEKIKFPFEIRSWRAGERFQPLGMRNQKKVSDFLTDLKCPSYVKSNTLVAATGDGIFCILAIRISDSVKVTTSTKEVLLISRHS